MAVEASRVGYGDPAEHQSAARDERVGIETLADA
jgi:hypothetical protein